jgi:hypothetical protein
VWSRRVDDDLGDQAAHAKQDQPGNPGHDDQNAEDFDRVPDEADAVVSHGLQRLGHPDKGATCAIVSAAATRTRAGPSGTGYFAFTLEVIEPITVDAISNWSLRFFMPWRRAIQSKSV